MKVPGIPFVAGRNVYKDRDGKKYGIAIHNTSNNASDENEASYATRRTDGTSSHFYCDKDSVIQSIDTDKKAGHAGSSYGNENAIAFEITGSNASSRTWWLTNVAWKKLAQVIAYMIKHDPDLAGFQIRRATVAEMKANPKIKAFYGHDDMRRAWGGTTHTDPGTNFPWDKLIAEVKKALASAPVVVEEDMPTAREIADAVWAKTFADGADKTVHPAGDYLRFIEYNIAEQLNKIIVPKLEELGKRIDALGTPSDQA